MTEQRSMQSRRSWLKQALGLLSTASLQRLATGLPYAALCAPSRGLTAPVMAAALAARKAQFLIYSTSSSGDPINCNAPGAYVDVNCRHPTDARMAPADIALGSVKSRAAGVWNAIPAASLARSCFFHHATNQIAHSSQATVQRLSGAVAQGDMLVSMYARLLQPLLGTVQAAPFVITGVGGGETIQYQGSSVTTFNVSGLKAILLNDANAKALSGLKAMRNSTLDAINADLKARGNSTQRRFLDQFASSQSQVDMISQSSLDTLTSLQDDSQDAQMQAAAVLVQLKLSPVVVTRIAFGGDNHGDANLAGEVSQHVTGTATIAGLCSALAGQNLTDQATFALINVFGRDNSTTTLSGRQHNDRHSVAVLIGANLRGSVVGGVTANGGALTATGIDAASGQPLPSGGIDIDSTMGSLGKTLGVALGLSSDDMDAQITSGQLVSGALVS